MPPVIAPIFFGPDTHANLPAASVGRLGSTMRPRRAQGQDGPGQPVGALYSCTTHGLIYKTDGSTWSTYATLGGSPTELAEVAASALVNATATGDAGNFSDHFPGTSLDARWASEAAAATAGPTVKYSTLGIAASTAHHRLAAFTPSGAFRVECRVRQRLNSGCSFLIRDSGTGDASGNGMSIFYDSSNFWTMYSLDTGTYNSRGSVSVATGPAGDWIYLAIERNGSNQWLCQVSLDRTLWISCAALYSKTFTVAKAGWRVASDTISVDFIDVVS